MTQAADFYRVLQVDPSADQEVVEAAYRRLARKYHPDLNPDADAGALMRQLNEAYAVLKDPARRAEYDRSRVSRPEPKVDVPPPPRAQPPPVQPRPKAPPQTVRVTRPRREPPRPQPVPEARPGRATPPPSPGEFLVRNRVVLTTAACAVIAAAIFAALAANLFTPGPSVVEPTPTPASVVLVNRSVAAEPTATFAARVTPTAAPWPPFPLDRPVQADGSDDGSAVGSFLSRAGQDLRSRLGGPRGPSPPSTPTGPG